MTTIKDELGNCFQIEKVLGRGIVGITYKATVTQVGLGATNLHIGQEVALKSQPVRDSDIEDAALQREIDTLKREGTLLSRRTAKPDESDQHDYIIQPLFPGINLRDAIDSGTLTAKEKENISVGLLKEIDVFQKLNITHCDLKPDNILYDRASGTIKIIDMGQAFDARHPNPHGQFEGPGSMYMPPETYAEIKGIVNNRNTHQSDLYSVGIIIASLYASKNYEKEAINLPPFNQREPNFNEVNFCRTKLAEIIDPSVTHLNGMPDGLLKVVQHLTAVNPKNRPQSIALCNGANQYPPLQNIIHTQNEATAYVVQVLQPLAMKAVANKADSDPIKKKLKEIFSANHDLATIQKELCQLRHEHQHMNKHFTCKLNKVIEKIEQFNHKAAKQLQAERIAKINKQAGLHDIRVFENAKIKCVKSLINAAKSAKLNKKQENINKPTLLLSRSLSNSSYFDKIGKLFSETANTIQQQTDPKVVISILDRLTKAVENISAEDLGNNPETRRKKMLHELDQIKVNYNIKMLPSIEAGLNFTPPHSQAAGKVKRANSW